MTQGLVIVFWLALCALQDMRQRQIANVLTLGGGLLALIYLLWVGVTWIGAPASDGGWAFALALLLGLPGYAQGRFGAGDVKLLAALGLATHTEYLLWSLIGSAVAMCVWIVMRQGLSARVAHQPDQASIKQPFAPYLLTGFIASWLWIH
ncbi:prepilin peptidase [Pseudomonas cremoris]|uniref:prepilin peptidase n=1 Tax=Pseudomonas cremoris TaxID=2724178 RepID=UPI0028A1DF4A|nr:prepilin peptidase [Pseudomonas cremoris]